MSNYPQCYLEYEDDAPCAEYLPYVPVEKEDEHE
jgi:hypothetical protein